MTNATHTLFQANEWLAIDDHARTQACTMEHAWTAETRWGQNKMAHILQMTYSNAFSFMKMHDFLLEFHKVNS